MTDRLQANKAIQGTMQKYTFDAKNVIGGSLSDQDLTLISITALNLASNFNIQSSTPFSNNVGKLMTYLSQQQTVTPVFYVLEVTYNTPKGSTVDVLNSIYQIVSLASGFEHLEHKVDYILGHLKRCGGLEEKSERMNPKLMHVPKSWHESQEPVPSQPKSISVEFKKRD